MSPFLELLLLLALIVLGAKLAGVLSGRFGQPSVLGEILFGLVLGPSLINVLALPVFSHPEAVGETTHLMAELGVVLLMFLAGLETDMVAMRRVGLPAMAAAVGGVLLPFAGGWLLGQAFGLGPAASIFLGTILTATSVSISAQTLIELGQMRSKEGTTILGAAVIDDVVGILILSVVVATFTEGGGGPLWMVGARMALFFAVGLLAAPLMRRTMRWFEGLHVSEPVLAGALVILFAYALGAEALGGVAAITGSYLAGIILAQTHLKHRLEEKMQVLVYGLFVPVFFVDIGLNADLRSVFTGPDSRLDLAALVLVVAIAGKVVGAGAGALVGRFSPSEALRVGTGMVSRGEVGLIVASVGITHGLIGQDLFSVVVLMVIATTLVTPILLRLVFPSPVTAGAVGGADT